LNLRDEDNKIVHNKSRGVKIHTSDGLEISKPGYNASFKFNVGLRNELDGFSIKNLPTPVNDGDAATKGYVNQVAENRQTFVEGTFPNAPYTNIVLTRFPLRRSAQQKPTIVNVYVELDQDEWYDVTCDHFANTWRNFSLFIKDNCLFCHFTSGMGLWWAKRFRIIYLKKIYFYL